MTVHWDQNAAQLIFSLIQENKGYLYKTISVSYKENAILDRHIALCGLEELLMSKYPTWC